MEAAEVSPAHVEISSLLSLYDQVLDRGDPGTFGLKEFS